MNNDENDTEKEITPSIEIKLDKNKRLECRQIVQEIKNFGVNQRQILYLVQLLALELENREIMLSIIEAVKEGREKIEDNILEIPNQID